VPVVVDADAHADAFIDGVVRKLLLVTAAVAGLTVFSPAGAGGADGAGIDSITLGVKQASFWQLLAAAAVTDFDAIGGSRGTKVSSDRIEAKYNTAPSLNAYEGCSDSAAGTRARQITQFGRLTT
jgi:hypothetical protein